MRHLWQWFCGYVCICLKGHQVNRFFNLCSKNGIHLWRISHELENEFRAHIRLRDFFLLKPYLKKTHTKLWIVSRKGFPFWCNKHPRLKWMFVLGFLLICISIYSLNFIWSIEISGNSKISTNEMLDFLAEQNVTTGKKSEYIDCTYIEYLLRQEYVELGWVTVYVDHTKLCIEVKESLYNEYENNTTTEYSQYDLVADKDAYIHSIITRSGTSMVNVGKHVKKGDVLVLGQYEVFDDSGEVKEIRRLRADALIYGDVVYTFVDTVSEMEILSLKMAGSYTDEMLLFIANQKISHYIENLEENGVIILEKNVMIDKNEKNIMFIGKILVREQIGINIPAEEKLEYELE